MQIQCKLRLKQLQREYLKARYEIRGKQRIHGKPPPYNIELSLICSEGTSLKENKIYVA